MLDPYSIANTANQEIMNIQPKVEEATQEAAKLGKSSILFDWKTDEMEAKFVELKKMTRIFSQRGLTLVVDQKA